MTTLAIVLGYDVLEYDLADRSTDSKGSACVFRFRRIEEVAHRRIVIYATHTDLNVVQRQQAASRLALELWLFQREATHLLGTILVFLGWPYTILLLVASYLYGLWRLGHLQGPSVDEFKAGAAPPWEGQKHGF